MIELRPQQVVFEDTIREEFRQHRCVLGVAATGFGKGVVVADMAAKAVAKSSNVLIVTNRRRVVHQLIDHCEGNDIHTGVIMGAEYRDASAPVQIASIHTLRRRGHIVERLRPGFIILDEAHQENAAYQKLLHQTFPETPALGLTATPVGAGGARLAFFNAIVEPIKNSQVIEAGNLLKVQYLAPSEPDMKGINLKSASQEEIGKRLNECTIYGDVFREWEPFSHMQTLVVTQTRAIANAFCELAVSRGIKAVVVDGTTSQNDRTTAFDSFQSLNCQMIVGVDVIREGLDLTSAQCLIDLQVNHQFRAYWQKVGRVKRLHPGQENAVVLDLVGNLWRHMVHPDQDPPWHALGKDVTIEEAIKREKGTLCPKCGSKEYYGPVDGLYKCGEEDCGESWSVTKPWVCPHCAQALSPWQKRIGGKCPNCGETVTTKPTRKLRFESGSIRNVPVDEVRRRKKKKVSDGEKAWIKWLYIAARWNLKPANKGKKRKTLSWCSAMFKREQGYWPKGFKMLPDNPADMKRYPEVIYPHLRKRGRESR